MTDKVCIELVEIIVNFAFGLTLIQKKSENFVKVVFGSILFRRSILKSLIIFSWHDLDG